MSQQIKPLILHAHDTGPNPYKIAAAFEFLRVPYEVKLWQFGDGPNGVKGPVFTKINENGRVPAVEDPNTGVVSWESGAIMNYILRVYDKDNKLGPRNSEQARVDFDKWIFFLVSTLGPMMGQVNWFRYYEEGGNENALKRYVEQAYRCYEVLDGQLAKTGEKFILPGSTPTAVDLHNYAWVYQHSHSKLSLDRFPHIQRWLNTMGQLPEIRAAYEKLPKGKEV